MEEILKAGEGREFEHDHESALWLRDEFGAEFERNLSGSDRQKVNKFLGITHDESPRFRVDAYLKEFGGYMLLDEHDPYWLDYEKKNNVNITELNKIIESVQRFLSTHKLNETVVFYHQPNVDNNIFNLENLKDIMKDLNARKNVQEKIEQLKNQMIGSKRIFRSFIYGSLIKPNAKKHNAYQADNVILKLHTKRGTHSKWVKGDALDYGEKQKILLDRNLQYQIMNIKITRDKNHEFCLEIDMHQK